MDLSVLIPARNEEFLRETVEDIVRNKRGNTEVIVGLDGCWPPRAVDQSEDVTVLYFPESIGQREMVNKLARISTAKYVMKLDAHCAVDEGFDIKMMSVMQDNWTMAPMMRNLHVFDWVCPEGHRRYQGPTKECEKCGKPMRKEIVWIGKTNPSSVSYCFDSEPHFQYFGEFTKRPEGKGSITPSMSLQGSCFMMTRDKYFELDVCDNETFGSWGSQGIEVAVKTWLSGGEVMIYHDTWYAHMFRTQGGDFGFPYPNPQSQVNHAKKAAKEIFFNNKWPKQVRSMRWLVDKFWPVKGWTEEERNSLPWDIMDKPSIGYTQVISQEPKAIFPIASRNVYVKKGIVFYTDNCLNLKLAHIVQKNLRRMGLPITCVSLKRMGYGDINVKLNQHRGYLTMFKEILAGIENSKAEIIFLCEHDIIYPKEHFNFVPEKKDVFYYNENVWKISWEGCQAVHYNVRQTSGLCAYRELLLEHYRKRVQRTQAKFEELGDTTEYRRWIREQGFEPGTHGRSARVDNYASEGWQSSRPILDIRHDGTLTPTRWHQNEFRNQKFTEGWIESLDIPGWGKIVNSGMEFLATI